MGILYDDHFFVEVQVSDVVSTCNCHPRQLGKIRRNITIGACHEAVPAIIFSGLDYCNVLLLLLLLAGLLGYQIHGRLQKVIEQSGKIV